MFFANVLFIIDFLPNLSISSRDTITGYKIALVFLFWFLFLSFNSLWSFSTSEKLFYTFRFFLLVCVCVCVCGWVGGWVGVCVCVCVFAHCLSVHFYFFDISNDSSLYVIRKGMTFFLEKPYIFQKKFKNYLSGNSSDFK